MNDSPHSSSRSDLDSADEIYSHIFESMVFQISNMALMFLGKVSHPETGTFLKDLEAAKLFIDQLEMLQVKTKSNLNDRELHLLQENLSAIRLVFSSEMDIQASDA